MYVDQVHYRFFTFRLHFYRLVLLALAKVLPLVAALVGGPDPMLNMLPPCWGGEAAAAPGKAGGGDWVMPPPPAPKANGCEGAAAAGAAPKAGGLVEGLAAALPKENDEEGAEAAPPNWKTPGAPAAGAAVAAAGWTGVL